MRKTLTGAKTKRSYIEMNKFHYNQDGRPVNSITGQPYSRDEIVTNPALPLPLDIDPAHPYWQRRSLAELQIEKERQAKKSQKRKAARQRRPSSRKSAFNHTVAIGRAMAEQVKRVNEADDVVFVQSSAGFEVWGVAR